MKNKLFLLLLIVGIVLRIVLAITTYHADLGAFALAGKYIVGQGKILSFYDESNSPENKIVFNYQPFAYLIPSFFYLPFGRVVLDTADSVVHTNSDELHKQSFYWPLLLYKFPLFFFDLAILWLLPYFFVKKKNGWLAQLVWLFNPVSIYVGSMMGQVDIIIAFWLLLAFKFLKDKKYNWSAFFVAISALIKPIGLILIPVIVICSLHKNKNNLRSLLPGVVGVLTYVLGILPYISSPAYKYYALFADQINKSTFAGIAIASGTQIPWFFIFYVLLLILFWKNKISALACFAGVLLSSLAFTHFHPQWLVWLMPLLLVWSIKRKALMIYLAVIFAWFCVLFSFDYTLHTGIFLAAKTAITVVGKFTMPLLQISLFGRGILVAVLVYLGADERT